MAIEFLNFVFSTDLCDIPFSRCSLYLWLCQKSSSVFSVFFLTLPLVYLSSSEVLQTLILTHYSSRYFYNPFLGDSFILYDSNWHKLVTPNLPPATDLFIQLHGRQPHLVGHSQLRHTVSKMSLSFPQLFLKQFYNPLYLPRNNPVNL